MKDLTENKITNADDKLSSSVISSSASCIELQDNVLGTALECSAGNLDSPDHYNILYRVGSNSVEKFVKLLVNNVNETYVSTLTSPNKQPIEAADDSSRLGSVFNCDICTGILYEPVTIPCGHTYCRKCLASDLIRNCRRCGLRFSLNSPKVNVIIGNLLEKWCSLRIKATRLRHEGNDLVHRRQGQEALAKYEQANEIHPDDHVLRSCHSKALLQLGCSEKALRHAERAVQLRPLWSEGYYRMAVALQSLGRYEEAVVAYLQCLVLAPDVACIQTELSKLLHKTLNLSLAQRISSDERYSPYAVPFRNCHSSPNSSSCNSDDSDSSQDVDKSCKRSKRRRTMFASCSLSSDKIYFDENLRFFQNPYLSQLIERCILGIKKMKKLSASQDTLMVDSNLVDKADFDCTLCYRMFWQPVTTPCGHVFCRMCLDRCLDHNPVCPLCKTSLRDYLAERRQSMTEFIAVTMKHYLSKDYNERQRVHEEEMAELASVGIDAQHEVPIFVCTMAFPTIPCPLHVFEPRYRLLIRQSIESGAKQFGMCPCFDDSENGFAEFGTMVEIREVQYFPDGRAIVDTIGNRRFKVVRKGMRDGYNTASIEFLTDIPIEEEEMEEIRTLHDAVHQAVFDWFDHLQDNVQQRILEHFGMMPRLEPNWLNLPNGPSWCWWVLAILPLDKRAQLSILAMTSLKKRLEALHRVLNYLQNRSII